MRYRNQLKNGRRKEFEIGCFLWYSHCGQVREILRLERSAEEHRDPAPHVKRKFA